MFAEHFKQRRIKLEATQCDVGRALADLKLPGVGILSQSTICRWVLAKLITRYISYIRKITNAKKMTFRAIVVLLCFFSRGKWHLCFHRGLAWRPKPPLTNWLTPSSGIKDYDLTLTSIFRFESLTLSHNNMIALKPVLSAWLEEAEAAKRDPDGSGGVLPPGEKKRKRTSIAAPEKRSLEAYFAVQPRPSGEKIAAIAEKLDLKKNVVRVWFCNQRQKQKRMKFAAQTGLWGQTASLAHTLAAGGHGPHHWPGSAISYQNDTMTHTTTNPKFEIGNGNTTTNSASDNDITEQNRLEQNYSNFYSTASMMIKKEELIINNSRYWWFQ